jgi:hypothetical protein
LAAERNGPSAADRELKLGLLLMRQHMGKTPLPS